MTHEWRKSSSLRDLLVLYRDSLFAASIVRRAAWEPVVPLDHRNPTLFTVGDSFITIDDVKIAQGKS
jgi:hypothetical protein